MRELAGGLVHLYFIDQEISIEDLVIEETILERESAEV